MRKCTIQVPLQYNTYTDIRPTTDMLMLFCFIFIFFLNQLVLQSFATVHYHSRFLFSQNVVEVQIFKFDSRALTQVFHLGLGDIAS